EPDYQSAHLADAPKSWTNFLHMVQYIRQEPCLEIPSQWLLVWRSCANSNRSIAGNCSTSPARNLKRLRLTQLRMQTSTSPFTGSARCSVCFLLPRRLSISLVRSEAI